MHVLASKRMSGMVLEGSERELLEACRRGEPEAFRELFETYKNKVYSVALRFSGNPATAMDIAQDTFVKLFACIGDFRGDSAFETWVYRLVANRCLDQKRKYGRLIPMAKELLATLRAPDNALTELIDAEKRGRVRSAVDRLRPDLRIVIALRYSQGMSYDQIGEVLGVSPGTVASRLFRAHKTLERSLAHLVYGEGGRV